MKAVWRQSRLMLPPTWFVALAVFGYVFIEALYVLAQHQGFADELSPRFHAFRGGFLIVAVCLYAAWRACWFHPLTRPGYRRWLETTPWRFSQPLPLGTVFPVVQDAVVIGAAALLAYLRHPAIDPLSVPVAYLLMWSAIVALQLSAARETVCAYAVAFGLAVVARCLILQTPLSAAGAAVLVGCCAVVGLRRSMAGFHHWDKTWMDALEQISSPQRNRPSDPLPDLGWPVARLNPRPTTTGISYAHGIAISVLGGWWCLMLPVVELKVWLLAVVLSIPVLRFIQYRDGCAPPISLWGRIRMGRWIIPGYDLMYVAPVSGLSVLFAVPPILFFTGWYVDFALALATTSSLLASLCMGPSLLEWQLTGEHRITGRSIRLSGRPAV